MASIITKSDRKQVSIILNLIKLDCVALYTKFHHKKPVLKRAIEQYEEFIMIEINGALFNNNNNFSDIVMNHRGNFQKFVDELFKDEVDNLTNGHGQQNGQQNGQPNGVIGSGTYAMCISLQEWLLQGVKGQQFYFAIDIDAFNLKKQLELLKTSRTNGSKHVRLNKHKEN